MDGYNLLTLELKELKLGYVVYIFQSKLVKQKVVRLRNYLMHECYKNEWVLTMRKMQLSNK